jgi:anti-anti-sigma regulatory factor
MVVDTQVAQGLIQVVRATRLLGAEIILVGIRPRPCRALSTMVTGKTFSYCEIDVARSDPRAARERILSSLSLLHLAAEQ